MGPLRRLALGAVLAVALLVPAGAASARPLAVFHLAGGIGGADSTTTVGPHGGARVVTRRGEDHRFHLSSKRLHELRSAFRRSHWAGLRSEYLPRQRVFDGFEYSVVHAGREVRTADGAKRPRRLQRVLDVLLEVAERHGGFG